MPTADTETRPSDDVTPYQFDVPAGLWDAYRGEVPAAVSVKRHMRGLVAGAVLASAGRPATPPCLAGERVDGQLWATWTDSVPRSVSLADRLEAILRADIQTTSGGGFDDMEERSARLLADRMKHRAQSAIAAMEREGVECDAAEENLETIADLAASFSK